jgi:ParB family chromosome partitioning protein
VTKVRVSDIVVPERFRKDLGDIAGLAESLKRFGQLQPIILDDDMTLVAGARRLAAAKQLGWSEIWATLRSEMTELQRREIELEENVRRLNMTWYEEACAIAEIDRIRRQSDPNWSQNLTAEVVGKWQADVSNAIAIVKMAELFPEIKDAKSLNQAKSWAQLRAASVVRLKEARDNRSDLQEIEEKVLLGDSVEVIKTLPDGVFGAIVTDSPFGIEYDKGMAGLAQAPTAYEDSKESYRRILSMASDVNRVLKNDRFCVWFLGPTWWWDAKLAFTEAGFTVDEIPVIWYRQGGSAFTTRPDRYLARHYDMALWCLKGNPEMTPFGRGHSNVFTTPPVNPKEKELLVERPVELYQEIIRCITVPGETVADFFVGSGSVLAAAVSLGRDYFGIEISPERRAVALNKIKAYAPSGTGPG